LKNKSNSPPKTDKKEVVNVSVQDAISLCYKHKIFIYPVYHIGFWYVEVDIHGTKKRFQKAIGKGSVLCSKKPDYD
jgi:hypothetical protein